MTSFRSIDLGSTGKKSKKKTTFSKLITEDFKVIEANVAANEYDNIVHLGVDKVYGDVFIAYDSNPHDFTIFFGEAGDEFKDNGE